MSRFFRMTPSAQWAAALLVTLALAPRLVALNERPLMHDESLFAFYAYDFMKTGHYTHIPMLHGPLLMLASGKLFGAFGDSIGAPRVFVAAMSLVALAAALALLPRRYRWWLAPLLFTSPVLLYYSRFMRDDMIFNGFLMLGMLGVARGLSRRPAQLFWAILGSACLLFLPAIMENSLFVYTTGITFGIVWGLNRWLWRGPSPRFYPRPAPPRRQYQMPADPPKPATHTRRRRRRGETYLNKSFASIVGEEPQAGEKAVTAVPPTPPAAPPATGNASQRWLWLVLNNLDWVAGALIGLGLVVYLYSVTAPLNPAVSAFSKAMQNLQGSWTYWKGQHLEHRIQGPIDYYLPILLTYELPLLIFLAVGLVWDGAQRWWRAVVYVVALDLWALLWLLWRGIVTAGLTPQWLLGATKFLHIEPNLPMLALGLCFTPLLAWSILSLREHRPLAAWMGWWAACSLFQYSSAGEKVPWLVVHIALPLYLTLGWLWAPRLRRMGRWGYAVAFTLILGTTALALRNDYYLIWERKANPRERILYNHTTVEFDHLCRSMLDRWKLYEKQIPLNQRRVLLVGDPGWPGVWYFRHCAYQLLPTPPPTVPADTDLLLGTKGLMGPLLKKVDPNDWNNRELSMRDAWITTWPQRNPWRAWWRYYWYRETWTPTGGFPIIALEPMKTRR